MPPKLTARNADRHRLYQLSVQSPDTEVEFLDRVWRRTRGGKALTLREDFCGTAALCAEWVRSSARRTATGLDISEEVLRWGRKNNLEPLGEPGTRVRLLRQDVRDPVRARYQIVVAFNYSYWIFRTRDEMRGYFRGVRRGLARDGLFLLDCYGGTDAQADLLEPRKIKGQGFTYVWHQAGFNPIDHSTVNHIHFEFPDGSRMEKAFTYEWRFWTLPELQELLLEAGFPRVTVWWDHAEDEDDERYLPTRVAENQPGWLAYLVAGDY